MYICSSLREWHACPSCMKYSEKRKEEINAHSYVSLLYHIYISIYKPFYEDSQRKIE